MSRFYSVAQVAKILNFSKGHVYNMIKIYGTLKAVNHQIDPTKKAIWRIKKCDLDDYLKRLEKSKGDIFK